MTTKTSFSASGPNLHWYRYLVPNHWLTWVGIACLRLITLLPLSVSRWFGFVLGELLYICFKSRRNVVITNISQCFPTWQRDKVLRVTKQNFRATGQGVIDTGIAWWASRRRLQRLVQVSGQEHFDQAMASGRPVILLVGHFVAIDIAGMYISSLQNITSIYKRPKNKLLHAMMRKGRLRFGTMTLIENREGIKPIMRAFKRADPFYFPADQDFGRRKSVFAPFFGIPAATVPTLGRLAKLSNAIVVPCFTKQLCRGKGYQVIFKSPIDDFSISDELKDAERMNQQIETAVEEMPEQYFWLHKRFKTRPDKKDSGFYK